MCVRPFYLDVSVLARHSLVSIRIGNRGVGHLNRVYSGPDWSYSLSSFFRHMSAVQTLHATTVFSIQMFSGIDVLALQACTKRRRLCLDNVFLRPWLQISFIWLICWRYNKFEEVTCCLTHSTSWHCWILSSWSVRLWHTTNCFALTTNFIYLCL